MERKRGVLRADYNCDCVIESRPCCTPPRVSPLIFDLLYEWTGKIGETLWIWEPRVLIWEGGSETGR